MNVQELTIALDGICPRINGEIPLCIECSLSTTKEKCIAVELRDRLDLETEEIVSKLGEDGLIENDNIILSADEIYNKYFSE